MRIGLLHIIGILAYLYCNNLAAQDSIAIVDTSEIKIVINNGDHDPLISPLVIQSYEELLETYYNAVVKVDEKINPNPYRLQPDNTIEVNPFVYENIILPRNKFHNLNNYKSEFSTKDPFGDNSEDIVWNSRAYIAEKNIDLITTTWRMLPDPPETGKKTEIIQRVNLDLTQIDRQSKRFNRPEKMGKQALTYQPWDVTVVSTISANQTSYSNWAVGGSNAFSLSGRVVCDADYTSADKKVMWQNNLESRLGYVKEEDKPFVKNLDLLTINTQYARNAVNKWFYAANAEFTSQFFNGYDYSNENYDDPISAFMAPAYVKVSLGLDYKYGTKKNAKIFSAQASPLSYKLTYVNDTSKISQTTYGIEEDKKARQEVGGSLILNSEYTYEDKVTLKSKLTFFSNYMNKPENIDINWNSSVTYNISRIFAVTFTLDMIYDDDISILLRETEDGTQIYGQRLQVKEHLGFTLTYRFM